MIKEFNYKGSFDQFFAKYVKGEGMWFKFFKLNCVTVNHEFITVCVKRNVRLITNFFTHTVYYHYARMVKKFKDVLYIKPACNTLSSIVAL